MYNLLAPEVGKDLDHLRYVKLFHFQISKTSLSQLCAQIAIQSVVKHKIKSLLLGE